MAKLIKYLKPFVAMIAIAIVLLFMQAMLDLALPDYMSNIVNVGIQQGGVENAVPKAIRESQMNKLVLFMDDKERVDVTQNYMLIDKDSSDFDKYVEKYPALESESIYVLKEVDELEISNMNIVMGKSLLAVASIEKMKDNAENGVINFNGMEIPANTDIFALFEKLPSEQRIQTSEEMNKTFTALGDSMVVQAATSAVKNEYKLLGMDVDKIQSSYIFRTGFLMIIISLLSAVCIVIVGFLASKVAAGLAQNLRKMVFSKVESFSNAELDKFSTASLITRTTNDITQIQNLMVMLIRMVFYAPILGIGGVIKALEKNSSMSWIIAVAVIALLVLIAFIFVIAMPKFKAVQKLVDRLNLVTRENLSGMMVIRAFNTQKFEEERFNKANKDLTSVNLFVNRVMVLLFPAMMLIMNGITLLIVWVGANQIAEMSMQVGDMMAFMQYAIQIIFAFIMMSFMFIMIPRASVSAQRISEVLETDATIIDPEAPKKFNNELEGVVEFKNVSFRYPGAEEDVLKNISFKASPGKTTALIGSTGSGKTTLVNLIPRFYDVTDGEVLLNGVDIRKVNQHDLRDQIGYIPQKGFLFSGTIESNLKYADKNATEKDLMTSLDIAQASEFVNAVPEGIKMEISQGGTNVSGGQKQRLAIARALMKKSPIYIFDDSFSALDFKTDASLRKAMKKEIGSSTAIIVAQRIATIKNAEQIIVLEEGEIVGTGTHQELLNNCETYKEIASSQLSKEELA
ncbi:ABC transporter ATP-binding protein [Clostridium sediminicola]|uniref:ABC transporter ATP-binding protein n=1 Tax=Clostridium sediminicola TaxID=3114879 RepID=UPI0031F2708F